MADCPDRDRHLRAARQAERIGREVADLKRQIRGRTESLARRFDQILQLLEAWGYLDGWALTARGQRLVRIFHESDLLIAESIESGLLDGLEPAALAGLVSCFTYEHRSSTPAAAPWFPSANVEHRFAQMTQLAAELEADEEASGLPLTRPPDAGFLGLAHAWVAGQPLDEILEDEELSGGDFVRNAKLLIDLLRQVADAAADPGHRPRRPPGGRPHVPGRGVGLVGGPDPRAMTIRAMTIKKGETWGAPGPLPADGVVVRSDAEARAVVSEARRSGVDAADAGPARRGPVPHARRSGRRAAGCGRRRP